MATSLENDHMKQDKISAFLNRLIELDKSGELDDVFAFIFDEFNVLYSCEALEAANQILDRIDPNEISSDTCVAALCYTRCEKSRLPSRENLYKKIYERIKSELGESVARSYVGSLE